MDKRPAYVEEQEEEFSGSDLEFPQVRVAQTGSPQLNKEKEEYIEKLSVGELFNSLTGEIYGKTVDFTPIVFWKETLVFNEVPTVYNNYLVSVKGDLMILAMKGSNVRVSKKMNSFIKLRKAAMYANVFSLTTVYLEGDKGNWYSFTVGQNPQWVDKDLYNGFKVLSDHYSQEHPKISWQDDQHEIPKDDIPF